MGEGRDSKEPRKRRVHPLADIEESESLLADLPGELPSPVPETAALAAKAREWSAERILQAFRGIAPSITANLDIRSLVRQILSAAITMLGAERGILFLGRGGGTGLVPVVALSIAGEEIAELERISWTILQRGRKGEILASPDATKDPRFVDAPSVALNEIHSVLCAPLVSRGEAIGVLYLDAPSTVAAFPPDAERLLTTFAELAAVALENARRHSEVTNENARLRRLLKAQESMDGMLAGSAPIKTLLQRAALAAQVETPILLRGEHGTGKEMLARAIHQNGPRALNPFIACNCAAVPRELIEAVLFGHVKGVYPGAQRDTQGLLREADRGTLFLNEIADIDIELQTRLLRALTGGVVSPVGGRREYRVDLHLISATSRDIRRDVREGRFLEALYYWINVVELTVPPLRERTKEIPLFVDHFLRKHGDGDPARMTPDALELLATQEWRGNLQELECAIQQLLVTKTGAAIEASDIERLMPVLGAPVPVGSPAGEIRPFVEQEREAIRAALIRARGNKSKAARLLGLHRNTLLRRMKKLDVAWKP